MLYRIALCCVVLHCIVSFCIVSYCTVLYCIALCCFALYCIVLHCVVLYYIVLHCIVLYCIVLHCIVLHCVLSYCIVLCCIVLYCTAGHRDTRTVESNDGQGRGAQLVSLQLAGPWAGVTESGGQGTTGASRGLRFVPARKRKPQQIQTKKSFIVHHKCIK